MAISPSPPLLSSANWLRAISDSTKCVFRTAGPPVPEHILLGEEGSGRFFATSYSPAAFLPGQGSPQPSNAQGRARRPGLAANSRERREARDEG